MTPQSLAQAAVARALREGRLAVPTTCEACGSSGRSLDHAGRPLRGIHLHHWSYAPEHREDVIPLCVRCHRWVHHGLIPEPRTGRVYKSPTGGRRSPAAVWALSRSHDWRPTFVRQVEYDICVAANDRDAAIAQIEALREREAAALEAA